MGEQADIQIEREMNKAFKEGCEFYNPKKIYPKWTTKDGKEVYLKDMTTSHIVNALSMLKRKGKYYPALQREYNKRMKDKQ